MSYSIRRARTCDVPAITALVNDNVASRRLLGKAAVTLYEDVQEFWVAERGTGPAVDGPGAGGPAVDSPAVDSPAVDSPVVDSPAVDSSMADSSVVGCGALHVMWEDLAEIRTLAVRADCRGEGAGHQIVRALLEAARELGVRRVFVLTFAVAFFARHGFTEIEGTPVSPAVYSELLRSYDEGVAEFLDLERVKPNTLGNTRMLLRL